MRVRENAPSQVCFPLFSFNIRNNDFISPLLDVGWVGSFMGYIYGTI